MIKTNVFFDVTDVQVLERKSGAPVWHCGRGSADVNLHPLQPGLRLGGRGYCPVPAVQQSAEADHSRPHRTVALRD